MIKNSIYSIFRRWYWIMPISSGVLLVLCANYCFFIWVPRALRSFIVMDIGVICGIYCGTLNKLVGALTIITGIGLVSGGLFIRAGKNRLGAIFSILFGILSIPVGLPAIFSGFFAISPRDKEKSAPPHRQSD